MARRRYASRTFRFWRFEMPRTVAILIALTIFCSLGGMLAQHAGVPFMSWTGFSGELVWKGQLWRLVTYLFVEADPLSFLFGILMMYWFGRDLCDSWGPARFVAFYLGLGVSAALVTCLVGRFALPLANLMPHFGNMPVADGLVIAWALRFPERVVNLYFVLQVSGRSLIVATIGLTVILAIYSGLSVFIPHFAAEAIVLASGGLSFRHMWLRYKQTRLKKQMRRYVDNVRRIDGRDDDDDGGNDHDHDDDPPATPPRKWVN
jgi:membrane associated rhomboid family serine protease